MLDLACSDPESQAGKRTVRAGMAITAHHRHAGQGCALLRADHVDDALAAISDIKIGQLMLARILVESLNLQSRDLVHDAGDTC